MSERKKKKAPKKRKEIMKRKKTKSKPKGLKQIAKIVLEVLKHGLIAGAGEPEFLGYEVDGKRLKGGWVPGAKTALGVIKPGQMCVEQAVAYAEGNTQNPGDEPKCVGTSVRNAKIALNDEHWSSNKARARGMQKIAIAQLGSNKINQGMFNTTLFELALEKIKPKPPRIKIPSQKQINDRLCSAKTADDIEDVQNEVADARDEIEDYWAEVGLAEQALGDEIDTMVSNLLRQPFNKVHYKGKDGDLRFAADLILEALKKCKSPGCKYLYLCK